MKFTDGFCNWKKRAIEWPSIEYFIYEPVVLEYHTNY